MTPIFKKCVQFTDIHLGLRNHSKEHNEDCISFVEWMIEEAKNEDAETCIFLGDFFHQRSSINISTLEYGLKVMELINKSFKQTYWIVGNHDMHRRHDREVNSTNIIKKFPNIKFIDTIQQIGDCMFYPFLVEDEYKQIPTHNAKYAFGHFELPHFMLNSLVEMPDHGEIKGEDFNCEHVFSGHFHNRQTKVSSKGTAIHYIGNCFPHNFSDSWDDERGICFMEHGGEPYYKKWPDAPKYRTMDMSELLKRPDFFLEPKVNAKVTIDCNLSIEEITFIKEIYSEQFKLRDFNVIPSKRTQDEYDLEDDSLNVETVDQIVEYQIFQIESNTLDQQLLLSIYRDL